MTKYLDFIDQVYSWIYDRQRELEEELLVNDNIDNVTDFQSELGEVKIKINDHIEDIGVGVFDEKRNELSNVRKLARTELNLIKLKYERAKEMVRIRSSNLSEYDDRNNLTVIEDKNNKLHLKKLLNKVDELQKYPWRDCDAKIKIVYRLLSNINMLGSSQCWNWTGSLIGRYGKFSIEGSYLKSHEVMYEYHYGIFDNKIFRIGHDCGNHICCNPDHLTRKLRTSFVSMANGSQGHLTLSNLSSKFGVPKSIIEMARRNNDKACGINLDKYIKTKEIPIRQTNDHLGYETRFDTLIREDQEK